MKHEAASIACAVLVGGCCLFAACATPDNGNGGTGGSAGGGGASGGRGDPASDGVPYNSLPWKLGLLTKTN